MAAHLTPSPRARILGRVFLGQLLAVWLLVVPVMVLLDFALVETGASWWSAWAFGGFVGTMLIAVPASAVAAVLLMLDRRATGPQWGWVQVILVLLLAPLSVIGVFGDYRASGATSPSDFFAFYYPLWMAEILPGLLITQAMLVFPRSRLGKPGAD